MNMLNVNPFSLEGKTILVTGASSGIGEATAIECSKMGARLVITGRDEERLQATYEKLAGSGHLQIKAELTNPDDVKRLVEGTFVLNGLVNNAGYNVMQLVPFIKEGDLHKIFEVNTLSPIYLTHALIKAKKLQKGSSVVFTSSISGRGVCSPGNGLYCATKAAVSAFARNAAVDLAGKQIRCNSVAPGMIDTPLKKGKSLITEEQWQANMQLYPLRRFGQPEDVAYAIIYLLSDAASWITGSELVVDGGRSLK